MDFLMPLHQRALAHPDEIQNTNHVFISPLAIQVYNLTLGFRNSILVILVLQGFWQKLWGNPAELVYL